MQIALDKIDNLINALINKRNVPLISNFSLGAASEFAAWLYGNQAALVIENISHDSFLNCEIFSEAWRLFNGGAVFVPPLFAHLDKEFYPIRSNEDLLDDSWEQLLQRFAASMKRHQFSNGLHQALAGALENMAENIVQHSSFGTSVPLNGFVAYLVRPRVMSFTVADVGIGAFASLRYNPDHQNVPNARRALELIARENASRRTNQGKGQGFKDLFVALAMMNGIVRIRSNDGMFMIHGQIGHVEPISASLHHAPGFQLTVECRI